MQEVVGKDLQRTVPTAGSGPFLLELWNMKEGVPKLLRTGRLVSKERGIEALQEIGKLERITNDTWAYLKCYGALVATLHIYRPGVGRDGEPFRIDVHRIGGKL